MYNIRISRWKTYYNIIAIGNILEQSIYKSNENLKVVKNEIGKKGPRRLNTIVCLSIRISLNSFEN